VQLHKTLTDALEGRYPHWQKSARPIYPIVVTLEEGYVFGHVQIEKIEARLREAWSLHMALLDAFPEDFNKTRENLFPEALDSITG
jgi:hypothetical protein